MNTQLARRSGETVSLVPVGAGKHARYRLGKFERWLISQSQQWHDPDLAAYRDHLVEKGYKATTIQAHLSTIRAQYGRLIKDNAIRDVLYSMAAQVTDSVVEQKAFVDEAITRLKNAADPAHSSVKVPTSQDRADSEHLRLTREQAEALMATPGTDTLVGLRDTAIIALMLCTGIREAELSALEVKDLRQRLGGELALHVREGKGCKERLIPYGQLNWVLTVIDAWLEKAGIDDGPVFRGLYKDNTTLRPGRLSVRAIQYILARHPIAIDGEMRTVKPHDLRRTYARRLYEAGMDTVAIQQNLGHADLRTTLGYIGTLDAEKRRAPAIYTFRL